MTKIRTIIGSTRPGWNGGAVARCTDTEFELADLVWREAS